VQHDAEREDIRTIVNGAAGDLLGRHVGRYAHDRAHLGVPGRGHGGVAGRHCPQVLGQAEVQHLDPAVTGHHNVSGLQIAVNDPFFMRSRKRIGQRVGNRDDLLDRQTTMRNELPERLPFDQFHGGKVDTIGFLDGKDRDNMRMILKPGRAPSFISAARYTCPMPPAPIAAATR
jgi:hypothetical protein